MRRRGRVLPVTAGISAVLIIAAHGASLEDGKAVFARREDTMKHMGRPLFLGIGRVVKGTAAYGPDTVTAAETVASLAGTLDRSLFLPGSDVAESKSDVAVSAPADRSGAHAHAVKWSNPWVAGVENRRFDLPCEIWCDTHCRRWRLR